MSPPSQEGHGPAPDPWTDTWPIAHGLVEVETVASTSDEIRDRAEAGAPGPLWIRADRQTAGRGRRGRAWVSGEGNLMTSVLLRPRTTPAVAAQISYVAALAVADFLARVLPRQRIGLKWPNDVRVDGAKIAGILLESAADTRGRAAWLSVGIGLNLAAHPDDAAYPTTSLRALGMEPPPAPRAALTALAQAFDRRLGVWGDGAGFGDIRRAWLDRVEGLGTRAELRLGAERIAGTFDGIDGEGALLLVLADGKRHTVHGGEVFFPDLATPGGPELPHSELPPSESSPSEPPRHQE